MVKSLKTTLIGSYRKFIELSNYPKSSNGYLSRILIYHDIKREQISTFEQQIAFISDNFLTTTAGNLIELYQNGKTGEKSYCVITFDDGFASIFDYAMPILEKYRVKATIFLNYNLYRYSEDRNKRVLIEFSKRCFPQLFKKGLKIEGLKKEQLISLIESGFEIGGHTVTHPNLTSLDPSSLAFELTHPVCELKKDLGYDLRILAYPYGRKKHFNEVVKKAARDAGYKAAFTGISQPLRRQIKDYMAVPRTCIDLDLSLKYFKTIFSGSEDFKEFLLRQR